MKACLIVILKKAALLFPLLLLCGCGGGGGNGGAGSQPDAIEILQQDGLRFSLEPEGPTVMGDEMVFWFRVENDGLKTRTLELRPRGDEPGARTCLGTISYDDGSENHPVVYELSRNDAVSVQVQPGEPASLVEFAWDQIRQDNGEAAIPGYYDIAIVLDNLYVDGKKPADWPTFEVRDERRVYFRPPGDPGWVDPVEKLRTEGLIISIATDKQVYQKGEPIPIWFHIRNEGYQTRTLEARPIALGMSYGSTKASHLKGNVALQAEGPPSYVGGVQYYAPDGQYKVATGFQDYGTISKQIALGETIRFVEYVWDQVKGDGTPAQAGYYDIFICLFNLYVDGQGLGYNGTGLSPEVCATIRIDE